MKGHSAEGGFQEKGEGAQGIKLLGKKQSISHEQFVNSYRNITSIVSKQELDNLIDRTVEDIKTKTKGKRSAYAWSGGKDSIALQGVCELAGVMPCVFGMTNLEFPDFLRWITDNMPHELEVINTRQDITWLHKNPNMLFPQNSTISAKWFSSVQHKAQREFYLKRKLDLIILGRRIGDGNFVGRNGENIYTSKGVTRFSPIATWRHEDIFAYLHYYKVSWEDYQAKPYRSPLPPIYVWPRGFRVGTGPWAARMWTDSIEHGWEETWKIDKQVVKEAASYIQSAWEFVKCVE